MAPNEAPRLKLFKSLALAKKDPELKNFGLQEMRKELVDGKFGNR